jgi:hypothetical protein
VTSLALAVSEAIVAADAFAFSGVAGTFVIERML